MQDKILKAIKSHGYQAQFSSAHHTKDLQLQIETDLKEGKIDRQLYDSYLKFDFSFNKNDFVPESLLIVAVKMPITQVDFKLNGTSHPIVIPPIYISRDKLNKMKSIISDIMGSYGYTITQCRLPSKLLAVRSGLSQYGRNNITYIPSLGSFYSITVFGSDMKLEKDNWYEPKMMTSCRKCTKCIDNCPTKCITSDNTMIDASRCLTYFNEQEPDFPSWILPSWHNSLIGCMNCQIVCPHNKDFIDNVDKNICFTEHETKAFLNNTLYDKLDETTKYKLTKIESNLFYDNFLRNLKMLIKSN